MTDPVFQQGFDEAKRRILARLKEVRTEDVADPVPFAYEPPARSPRRPGDVLDECIAIVEQAKCPQTKG
jgi:hypothetical protein